MQTFRKEFHREAVLDFYNLTLALVLFVSPWLFALQNGPAKLDLWLSSAFIAIISLGAIVAYASWEEWTNLLLGMWLVVSPWVVGFAHTPAMHFSIGVGAAVAFLAALEIFLRYNAAHPDHAPPHSRARCNSDGVFRGTFSVAKP
jgi:hypothetical protein